MYQKVYLDYNATTPLHPDIRNFVIQKLDSFGNPSSVHWAGREAKKMIQHTRELFSKFIEAETLEIVFTSGGSEANNLAIKGALKGISKTRNEIITTLVEHPSVLKTIQSLKSQGYIVRIVPINRQGRFDMEAFENLLSDKTALVSVQYINNETGMILPIKEIAEKAHKVGALVHSDMVQAMGKIQINVKELGVDLSTFSGHKFYSLKGVGALYIKSGTKIESLIHGGAQERSRRAGTENALAIFSLGEAIRVLGPKLQEKSEEINQMRIQFENTVKTWPSVNVNAEESRRAPNTTNIRIDGIDGETLLMNLDLQGYAISSGAACSSGSQEPSPVLTAMGFSTEETSQSMRVSIGWLTTNLEMERFTLALKQAIENIRLVRKNADQETDFIPEVSTF